MNTDDEVKLLRQIVRDIVDTMANERAGFDVMASASFDDVLIGVARLDLDEKEQRGEA